MSPALAILVTLVAAFQPASDSAPPWADQVTIHRDVWGVPHVDGETDAAVAFGSAWAQCEDHFFQLEDTYIQALGRYAEVVGEEGVRSDIEVAAFELVESSQRDFAKLPEEIRAIATAFAAGYDFFLERNPNVKPRLLERMEPWHVLAFERFMILGRLLGAAHAPRRELSELALEEAASVGSNQWAVGPSKTRDGTTMLFINPHQPWYGSGMFTEMHVRSGEGWNFSGTMYPGAPFPTAGFNDRLGWAYTVNEADVADVYRLSFDHPEDPLLYRYGDGWRKAREWSRTLKVKVGGRLEERPIALRASHYGPIVARENDVHQLAVRVPRLYDGSRMVQALAQTKSRSFEEWYRAASMLQLQTFNTMYADADGNIFYLYNGTVAKRDPAVDWTQPVDGSDPRMEWGEFHPIGELPQILNPPSGYLQNCNSTPFTTTDVGNPSLLDFPPYMVEDRHDDKRRAKMSRLLLREAEDLTFEDWQALAYDTTLYWPLTEIPRYARLLDGLGATDPELHSEVLPYFRHLEDWDKRSTIASTQATLAVEWYEQLYGRGYPVETLKLEYLFDVPARFRALVEAADRLRELYGDWKVPYGEIHRLQRHSEQTDRAKVPFDDRQPSLPLAGVRGPLGVAFTVYHTPPTEDPNRRLQYATTGASYMAVIEFAKDGVRAASYLHYGQSHDPGSPHFFDQAKLLSERRFKPAWLDWRDVTANTERSYRPGED
ncbi:MAG TPA: penicillin acylase family protein [Thermoanaerobaculia bacterium]|nr:penicillin acylase family protein [Thermoanaerobaculia bacterium]